MRAAEGVVDLRRDDILVAVVHAVEEDLAALIGRCRAKQTRQLQRRRREQRRVDTIAHEWWVENDLPPVARERRDGGEISGEHGGGGHELEVRRRHAAYTRPLIRG